MECLHALLAALVRQDRILRVRIGSLPPTRSSMSMEIFGRVSTARDFIESNYADAITLDDIAARACLSPHHVLRSFKEVVGPASA